MISSHSDELETTKPAGDVGANEPALSDAQSYDPRSRLRSSAAVGGFRVVLVEPEIPPNTGNIARMCAATGSELHLIHPLGFRVDEKSVRRAGLDYWHLVHVVEHTSFAEFTNSLPAQARLLFFSGKAARSFLEIAYSPGDYLVFGKESSGLSEEILEKYKEHLVGIPTLGPVRSLNLANAAALGVFEALRQTGKLAECSLQGVASGSGATSA